MTGEIKRYWQNYIAGERIDGGDGGCIAIENPATLEPLAEIAEAKMNDLNANDVDQAVKIIAGSARSMGIEVVEG